MSASKLLKDIPDDIVSKILLPLSVNDLLRCKSVCKSWLSILSDPRFVKSQLAFSNETSDDRSCIAHTYTQGDDSDTTMSLVNLDSGQLVADLDFPFPQDEFPYMPPSLVCLVGSACGIVCVRCSYHSIFDIYLWNPAIKMSKLIPDGNIRGDDQQRVVLGFGFNSIADDFKGRDDQTH
ncbi:putative F-box protein At3g16210 [Apium graveolens]|uniref:putative F-box protein At3g16210 n=1 Tax=Apium graveolens TaxID=4045 RepID=UPI003D79904F